MQPTAWAARLLPWLALATAAVAATRFAGDAIWPCPVSCQGGGHYQRLWGVPMHVPAVAVLLAVAGLAWARRREAAVVAWAAAGGSLYFLWLSWRLGIVCPYCLAVHGGVLATAVCAVGAPWPPRLAVAVIAFLGLHLAFHPGVVADVAPVTESAPPPVADGGADIGGFLAQGRPAAAVAPLDADLDALRLLGRGGSAYVLEVAIDPHCLHCAEQLPVLERALTPALRSGHAQVVLRFMMRPSAPTGRELASHILAAEDPAQARLLSTILIGAADGRGWQAMRSRVAEIADPEVIAERQRQRAGAIAALLDDDARRLRALGCRATPFAALSHRGGQPFLTWDSRTFDPQAIAREIPLD